MLNKREISKYKKAYQEKGYVLVKNFIDKKSCKTALNWLNKKNKKIGKKLDRARTRS